MIFEQFEKLLCSIGELDDIPGAAMCGSDDFYVKLWRCHGNDKVCQVHQLYEEVTKLLEYELFVLAKVYFPTKFPYSLSDDT